MGRPKTTRIFSWVFLTFSPSHVRTFPPTVLHGSVPVVFPDTNPCPAKTLPIPASAFSMAVKFSRVFLATHGQSDHFQGCQVAVHKIFLWNEIKKSFNLCLFKVQGIFFKYPSASRIPAAFFCWRCRSLALRRASLARSYCLSPI